MDDFIRLEVLQLAFDEFQRQDNPSFNGHQDRCALQVVRFAKRLRSVDEYRELITDDFLEYARWGARLHDIGKARIDEHILNKSGKLSEDDWLRVKAHPENGSKLVTAIRIANHTVAELVLNHQEKWDGSGYPKGLREYDIPFIARMFKPIDVIDAMTNDRSYRQVFSVKHALDEMTKEVGISFDPNIFAVFLKFVAKE